MAQIAVLQVVRAAVPTSLSSAHMDLAARPHDIRRRSPTGGRSSAVRTSRTLRRAGIPPDGATGRAGD